MEPGTQEEMQKVVEAEEPVVVDINQASVEELGTLPGVGPALAQRIHAYREEHGPFRSPEDVASVPGIGPVLYQRLADRLTVTLEEALPLPLPAEEPPPQEEPAPEAEAVSLEEEPTGAEAGPAPAEAAPEEAPALPPPTPAAPEPQAPPVALPAVFRGRGLSWLWSALAGGVLGLIFTLLVLSGINGSLDIAHSQAVLQMENRMEGLAAETDSLQGEIEGLRQRLDVLGGLTARMDQAETSVEELREEAAALNERAEALEGEVTAVLEDLAAVQVQSERVEAFFQRLQAMLGELFGEAEATPVPSSPTATPSPGQ
jgi:competence ComEA-like helix-hairpin-helix protein